MKKLGFTLIELSIVLVIIGLIVGGVLVGRDLIRTAEVRSQIKQIESLETAIGAFRVKYNCLPGDCATATSYFTSSNTVVNGDGNGIISSLSGSGSYNPYSGDCLGPGVQDEIPQLFLHLNLANLTDFASNGSSHLIGTGYPFAKLGGGFFVSCLNNAANTIYANFRNSNILLMGTSIANGATDRIGYKVGLTNYSIDCMLACKLTTEDARRVDEKLDDGAPYAGRISVIPTTTATACAFPTAGTYAGAATTGCYLVLGKKLHY